MARKKKSKSIRGTPVSLTGKPVNIGGTPVDLTGKPVNIGGKLVR